MAIPEFVRLRLMATVEEINRTFTQQGLDLKLPLPGSWLVKDIQVLEKTTLPDSRIVVLFGVKFYDESGKELSDVFLCEGEVKATRGQARPPVKLIEPLKSALLPLRDKITFDNAQDAIRYLREAITHLLEDKGYQRSRKRDADLWFEKGPQGFLVNLAARCDDSGLEKARELSEARKRYGSNYDYGLVVPAFQESLGIPLHVQESWVFRHQEYLSAHRIGVYAVHNQDPNLIYAFTIYPRATELMKYFFVTATQWSFVRARYVEQRGRL